MKKFLALMFAVCLAGCSFEIDTAAQKTKEVTEAVTKALPKADKVTTVLENETGLALPVDAVGKAESVVDTAAQGAKTAGVVARMLSGFPVVGPYASAAGVALDGLTGLLLAAGAFLERRKRKKTEKALQTVTKRVDDVPGIGKKLKADAIKAGIPEIVEAAYIANQ